MTRKERQRARDVQAQRQRSRAILAAMDSVGWPEEETAPIGWVKKQETSEEEGGRPSAAKEREAEATPLVAGAAPQPSGADGSAAAWDWGDQEGWGEPCRPGSWGPTPPS